MHDIRCVYIFVSSCQKRAMKHKFCLLVNKMYMFVKVPVFPLKNHMITPSIIQRNRQTYTCFILLGYGAQYKNIQV
jgi:hypothetical protein